MKIIIVTQKEPFFIPSVLSNIIGEYKKYLDAVVFLKPGEFKRPFRALKYYLQFWGPGQFLRFGLKFLKYYFRKIDLNGVEVIENIDVNSPQFVERAKKVDYVMSIAANQIFKKDLLEAPRVMCLNIHAALLPRYRGYNPSFWVLKNGEKETGITIHKMTAELDRGPILMQRKIEISPEETWISLQRKVAEVASGMLIELLPVLETGNPPTREMTGEGSLFRKPKAEDGKEFRKNGGRFI